MPADQGEALIAKVDALEGCADAAELARLLVRQAV
jgi:hypothetical protein